MAIWHFLNADCVEEEHKLKEWETKKEQPTPMKDTLTLVLSVILTHFRTYRNKPDMPKSSSPVEPILAQITIQRQKQTMKKRKKASTNSQDQEIIALREQINQMQAYMRTLMQTIQNISITDAQRMPSEEDQHAMLENNIAHNPASHPSSRKLQEPNAKANLISINDDPYHTDMSNHTLPFVKTILQAPLPPKFKLPQIKLYEGTKYPIDHLYN